MDVRRLSLPRTLAWAHSNRGRPTMATTKRGLDDGHVPGSKRRAPDPYEYERICDLPDALDCFADPRARSTPNGSAVSAHPSLAMPCQLGGHEPSRSHWQARRRRLRRAASCATGAPQTSTRQRSRSCCRRQRPSLAPAPGPHPRPRPCSRRLELLSLYLSTSPYTSNRKLQTRLSPCISLHLPTSPYTSLHLQAHASLEEDEELDEEALLDFAPQLGAF